ncbi:GNAT family N-acetyltransferase [Bremerella sp. P1]|uniref:GNAT family N-acetyltransferase n=1 Tax=Bremerella sp. P1 TaxID=3026424 RepID=UPI002368808A|nr:GNAT family N-acetyltransferase [Bremerella sp. P1]WDI44701.1 GNAT family N-acetyltransferase [Bremerella sp. P1]
MATDCPSSDPVEISGSLSQLAQPLRVDVVTDVDSTSSLFVEWERLAGQRLFLAPRWLLTWWKHYRQNGSQLQIVTIRDDNGWLIGLAPWYRRHTWWGGDVIQLLGSGEVCSDYLSVLAKPGEEAHVVNALAQYLPQQFSEIDRLYFEGLDASDTVMHELARTMRDRQYEVKQLPQLDSYRLALPATWDEWVSQLSRSRRHRVRQLWRNQFETGKATIHIADQATLEQGFSILVDLHQKRRNQMGQRGCFASNRFHDFLQEAASEHLESAQLRLQWIELEGRPIAVELDLEEGDTLLHYCSGIATDCDYARPGWLGITAAIRYAIDSGKATFDFLRGDEGYKSHWRGQPVPMMNLEFVPPKFSARLRSQFRGSVRLAKQQAKRILQRPAKSEQTDGHSSD